jgi:hypothetical protein
VLPATSERVEQNTSDGINSRIAGEMEARLRHFADNPDQIGRRLAELDAEWDMERTLEANAATLALTGTLMGVFLNKRFLILPVLVTGFLLQHALQGWCPPVPFFRKRGVRTANEIERERYALKALRGDFRELERGTEQTRATVALRAATA